MTAIFVPPSCLAFPFPFFPGGAIFLRSPARLPTAVSATVRLRHTLVPRGDAQSTVFLRQPSGDTFTSPGVGGRWGVRRWGPQDWNQGTKSRGLPFTL